MIQLAQFLNTFNNAPTTSTGVLCFTSSSTTAPIQLLHQIIHTLAQKCELEIMRINVSTEIEWQFQLAVTFLGNARLYWLLDVENQKNVTQIMSYLDNYQGPHWLITYLPRDVLEKATVKHCTVVDLPADVDKKFFGLLATLLYGLDTKNNLITDVFQKIDKISIDQACVLLNYITVLGASTQELLDSDWLEKIIIPDRSLFLLSQYFFAKDENQFFHQWKKIQHDYSDLFWISFWSEQLWRAYYVILFNKKNVTATLKKMSYRMPFSFTQRHWKNYDCIELANAHNYLYVAEYNIKNGGTIEIIESFYGAFFCNNFKN